MGETIPILMPRNKRICLGNRGEKKPGDMAGVLKRTMAEKNGESTPRVMYAKAEEDRVQCPSSTLSPHVFGCDHKPRAMKIEIRRTSPKD